MIDHEGATKKSIAAFMKDHGLILESAFVPWSRSRSFDAKTQDPLKRNLNWKVTLKRNGREVLTCDYSSGIGHAPCYKSTKRLSGGGVSLLDEKLFVAETESGFACSTITRNTDRSRPIFPDSASVLSSLAMDSNVLDYRSFEEWAPELGYDADSRSAEKIYRECLTQALALRNGLGEDLLAKLRAAVSDY